MQVLRRLARDDVDRAADDILAEQRALRSAQNLDALDVEQQGVAIFGPAEIDAIDEQSVRRIGARRAVISANAPNGKAAAGHRWQARVGDGRNPAPEVRGDRESVV